MVVLVGSCICDKLGKEQVYCVLRVLWVMVLCRRKPGKELRAGTWRLELRRNHGETLLTPLVLLTLLFCTTQEHQSKSGTTHSGLGHIAHQSRYCSLEFGSHWVTSSCNCWSWGSDIFFQSL